MTTQIVILVAIFASVCLFILGFFPVFFPKYAEDALLSGQGRHQSGGQHGRTTGALLFASIVLCGCLMLNVPLLWALLSALVGGAGFFAILTLVVRQRQKKRLQLFDAKMLDFLVLVCNNLKNGFALPNAIELAAKSVRGVVGDEFNITMGEYRLGVDLSEAIKRMTNRVNSENLWLFSATIAVSIQTGSSVTQVLGRLIATIRKRNEMADKLRGVTAQFNFEALMMSFMPFVAYIILFLLDRNMMEPMITTPTGLMVMAGLVCLEAFGLFCIKKLCAIKM